jgi:hypothetical protein
MAYSIMTIRSADEEDARLFPRPTPDNASVLLDSCDGEPLRVPACALRVRELSPRGFTARLSVTGVEVDVLVTDARVTVACARLANGHTAQPARDGMLVGHVRYAWLSAVGFKPKNGWRSSAEVRLAVVVRSAACEYRNLCLDLALPKSIDSSAVARAIAERAARYRLAFHDGDNDVERAHFATLAAGPSLHPPGTNRFAMYEMPRYVCVSAASAYPHATSDPPNNLAATCNGSREA